MARRDEQVNIRLTGDRKRGGKQAAEEHERPLTQFIRWCVEQEIADEVDVSLDGGKLDTIIEQIQSLDSAISGGPGSISHRLTAIEGHLADDSQERELATTVYGLLPSEDGLMDLPDMDDPSARVSENGRVVSGRPEHIAEYIRYSPDFDADPTAAQVGHALDELQADLHNVHSLDNGRYYRS